jgi:hypothetical protein
MGGPIVSRPSRRAPSFRECVHRPDKGRSEGPQCVQNDCNVDYLMDDSCEYGLKPANGSSYHRHQRQQRHSASTLDIA